MALTAPSIQQANLSMNISPSVITPLLESIPVNLPINFTSMVNLEVLSGSYTPNNDTLSLASSIPTPSAPNFLLLICDKQLNLTVKSGANVLVAQNPVFKVFFSTLVGSNGYAITDILFDGQTSDLNPMPQHVLVNYTLVYGQATIS